MSKLINGSQKSLSCQLLSNPYISNSIDWTQELCYFGNKASISSYSFELDQNQNFENHIDILASYPFSRIELELERDPDPPVDNFISLFDSIMTPVFLPIFFIFQSQH